MAEAKLMIEVSPELKAILNKFSEHPAVVSAELSMMSARVVALEAKLNEGE